MALHLQNVFISRFNLSIFNGRFITTIKQFYRKSLLEKKANHNQIAYIKFYKSFLFLNILKSIILEDIIMIY